MLEIHQHDKADRRSSMKIYFHGFRGLGRKTSGGRLFCADRSGTETFPQQTKNAFCVYKCTACQVAKLGMKERIRHGKCNF